MHKVFISYHHQNDQFYKDQLVEFGERHSIFIDMSVDTGDIPDTWTEQQIRREIRDQYLKDSTVTIVLAGTETNRRKHIDWEIYSSMYDGPVNKRSGILAITLPSMPDHVHTSHGEQEKKLYSDIISWTTINTRAEYERRYPYMPSRIIDNFMKSDVKISVIPWNRISTTSLTFLIDAAYRNRENCQYDLSRPMRHANS
ncbi:MAG: TIR domain-containing protein [Gammaproteobacteria bacterium]|nr:TIR domain-containing protein [Gammaproteobacteria bacterium]